MSLEKFKAQLKEGYEKEQARQKQLKEGPDSPEKTKNARIGGLVMLFIGSVFAGINYFTWTSEGSILKWALALMLGLWIVGIYSLITGKLPGSKK